ncbi:MAG: hypothetical protein ACFE0P_15415 [Oceanicaulis sp.]
MVKEHHYFAAYSDEPDRRPVEFYRLTVTANTALSNSRFVAGYYDERAVDLLFDEIRVGGEMKGDVCDCTIEPIFTRTSTPDVEPLAPTPDNGAFVMILSSNADAVAGTIGAFAESQLMADAISNIVHREELRAAAELQARTPARSASAGAATAIIEGALRRAREATGEDETQAAAVREAEYRRALNAIARGLGRAEPFDSFEEARGWFEAAYLRLEDEEG